MDLVYILGSGSDWSDNEIRYSLRSAEQYFPHNKVYVIGRRPFWLEKVIHIPYSDNHQRKSANAIDKIMRAAREDSISDPFVLMNDDFFFLAPQTEVPYYYRGTTSDLIKYHKKRPGYYYETLLNTEAYLIQRGVDNLKDYEVHAPIIYEKQKLLNLSRNNLKNCQLRSVYCNSYNVGGVEVEDFKAHTLKEFKEQLKRNAPIFSSGDAIVKEREFLDWISKRFTKPSKHEVDNWKINLI